MEPTKSEVLRVLDKIAASLPSGAEQYWSAYIDEARRLLRVCDYAELELVSSIDGLGSLEAELNKVRDMFLGGESWGDWEHALGGSS